MSNCATSWYLDKIIDDMKDLYKIKKQLEDMTKILEELSKAKESERKQQDEFNTKLLILLTEIKNKLPSK